MNPLHIPRTVLACVGVVIDTAVRMHCQNRDYEAAVGAAAPKSERGLVEAEAEIEVHESSSSTNCPPGCNAQGWHFSDDNSHVVLHDPALVTFPIDPAASATAALSPAIPPASDTDPVGVVDGPPASAAPAGPPSELAELIARVLYEHHPREDDGHKGYGVYCRRVDHPNHHAYFLTWKDWRAHISELIAQRIEKATPAAGLTPDDLRLAASAIYGHALAPFLRPNQATEFERLADRLHELADRTP